MYPAGSITKPEPSEVALRGCASGRSPCLPFLSKKSLKNSSNGEPGGNCGRPGTACSRCLSGLTVCVVEILTTAGTSFSARSANPSGAGRAAQEVAAGNASTNAAAAATDERRNRNVSIDTLFDSSQQKPEIARIKLAWILAGILFPAAGATTAQAPHHARLREMRPASQIPSRPRDSQLRNSQTSATPIAAASNPDARKTCGGTCIARWARRFIPSGNSA